MARQSNSVSARRSGTFSGVSEKDISQAEKETRERVNHALATLKIALASWEATKKKPADLKPKFIKYHRLHEVLNDWQKREAELQAGKAGFDDRIQMLWEYVDICQMYS